MDTKPVIDPELDDSTLKSGENPGSQTHAGFRDSVNTHSSRIVAIVRTNPLLPISLSSIFLSIMIPFFLYRILYFVMLAILLGTLIHSFRPKFTPFWFRGLAEWLIRLLQEKPAETIAALTIITLTLINRMLFLGGLHTASELISVTLTVFAFYVFGYRPPGYSRSLRDYFKRFSHENHTAKPVYEKKDSPEKSQPPEKEREQSIPQQSGQVSIEEEQWEQRQKERWESWLAEEVERFEGGDDHKDSASSS